MIFNKKTGAWLLFCSYLCHITTKKWNVMFAKETYVQRRARLKKTIGSGVLLFLGNDEQGLNYEDNTFRDRKSTRLNSSH